MNLNDNGPDEMIRYKKMSMINLTLDMYNKKFGEFPVRVGKENEFTMKDGSSKTIREIFDLAYNTKPSKRRDSMDMGQYDSKVTDKGGKTKPKAKKTAKVKAGGKVNLKQFARDKIAEGLKPSQVRQAIVDRYVEEGKKKEWAVGRAKAIESDVSRNG